MLKWICTVFTSHMSFHMLLINFSHSRVFLANQYWKPSFLNRTSLAYFNSSTKRKARKYHSWMVRLCTFMEIKLFSGLSFITNNKKNKYFIIKEYNFDSFSSSIFWIWELLAVQNRHLITYLPLLFINF